MTGISGIARDSASTLLRLLEQAHTDRKARIEVALRIVAEQIEALKRSIGGPL